MVVIAGQVSGPGRQKWMEPAGLAALVLGCPMLQPGVMDDFFTLLFLALWEQIPTLWLCWQWIHARTATVQPGRRWHRLLGTMCAQMQTPGSALLSQPQFVRSGGAEICAVHPWASQETRLMMLAYSAGGNVGPPSYGSHVGQRQSQVTL